MTFPGPASVGLSARALAALQRPLVHKVALFVQDRLATDLTSLREQTGLTTPTLQEILTTLQKAGIIQAERDADGKQTYAMRPGVVVEKFPPLLPASRRGKMAQAILDHPGSDAAGIAERVGCARKSVLHHARALAYAGFVQVVVSPEGEAYHPTQALKERFQTTAQETRP